jgi:hypothetical protein
MPMAIPSKKVDRDELVSGSYPPPYDVFILFRDEHYQRKTISTVGLDNIFMDLSHRPLGK